MNCLNARRALCGLDDAPASAITAAGLAHARTCPRCRRLGLRFADAILAAAGDEMPCAECQTHLDRVALDGSFTPGSLRREPELAARLQAHLAACPDCSAELLLLRSMLAMEQTTVAGPEQVSFDTRFARETPVSRRVQERSRRLLPVPVWLRGGLERMRELAGALQGGQRASRAALAAMTAVVVFVLARLVLQDPQLRSTLEGIVPFIPPAATADLDSLRAQATATAASGATQTARAATPGATARASALPGAGSPSPIPGGTGTAAFEQGGPTRRNGSRRRRPRPRRRPPRRRRRCPGGRMIPIRRCSIRLIPTRAVVPALTPVAIRRIRRPCAAARSSRWTPPHHRDECRR
ncbi:MAG: hypothetical protein IPJ58_12240 [Ardenticatenia bacterium]|nr:hypothetical protein [Ardenticatenia bacterium]